MAVSVMLSALPSSSIPKILSQKKSESCQIKNNDFIQSFPCSNFHGIGVDYGKNSSTRLFAGLSEVEPDRNEDPKDSWATNGIDTEDFLYGKYDQHHTYYEDGINGPFWETVSAEYTSIGPPTGFQGGVEKVYKDCSSINGVKNGVFVKGKMSKNGGVREFNGKGRGVGGLRGVEEKVHAKCSTKWRRYGGCIPAMLEALDVVEDLDEALRPWALNLTNKERSILLKEQLRWERAMEIFEWFKRKGCYEVNVIHYNIILRILGKAREWCEIERLWGEMVVRGIEPINSTYGTLIDVYSKGGLREEAIKWLELMKERRMEPDEVTMATVVQMYKAGEFDTAEEFFKKWSISERVVDER